MSASFDYRSLGRNGIKVSPLTLGTMMFGGQTDDATAQRIADRAFEQGVNFIDTANGYNKGQSEVVVGRLIAPRRSQWILSTKFVNPNPGATGPNDRGASRHNVIQSAEASLKRLGTDYIDLLYLHREDHHTPIAETVRALGDLIRAGKIRSYGLSNHRAWKLAEFSRTADALGVDRPAASQPLYNLANRQIETEHLPAADYYGIGVVPYSPLARGVLTAKYAPGETPGADTRAGRNDKRIQQTEWRPESLDLAQRVKEHAAERGISAGQFALAWVLNNRLVTSAIAGPRTLEQWDDYIPALQYAFTAEDEAFVDSLVVTGHSSTPGYNDPSHPAHGRQPRNGAGYTAPTLAA
ncbi:aldo/keto reductase [Xylophilus sp.]|uniref:aldo/keto reductase n=1 Tax=Xylophilus sp. TaxID=2653893 RepID=UPI0013B78E63|nr:aldo/keto reductase [Xylophilus sp.]KAF1050121.1 MAG: Aldo-keto reductase IolS [Xylophilus sp.]